MAITGNAVRKEFVKYRSHKADGVSQMIDRTDRRSFDIWRNNYLGAS